uniref:Uncharacterized protein n=1 Tax=Angiostrongylus cantonensis TaxID=6313 RepID=A0A0K0D483_ANGCA
MTTSWSENSEDNEERVTMHYESGDDVGAAVVPTSESDGRIPSPGVRLLLVDPDKYGNDVLRQNRQHERQFSFDAAFGPNSTQVKQSLLHIVGKKEHPKLLGLTF